MDNQIKVGMLVEIISDKRDPEFIGHVGRVLRPCNVFDNSWDIEGAEISPQGIPQAYASCQLRPISDKGESKDIIETREKGAPSFDELMKGLSRVNA